MLFFLWSLYLLVSYCIIIIIQKCNAVKINKSIILDNSGFGDILYNYVNGKIKCRKLKIVEYLNFII